MTLVLGGRRTLSRASATRRFVSLAAAGLATLFVLSTASAAFAASWVNEYPTGTIHVQPTLVGANVLSSVSLRSGTQQVKIDNTSYSAILSNIGTVRGHWVYSESLVNGVWTGRWTWVTDPANGSRGSVYS
jgi:hypothetical protein